MLVKEIRQKGTCVRVFERKKVLVGFFRLGAFCVLFLIVSWKADCQVGPIWMSTLKARVNTTMSWSPHINSSFQAGIIVLCAVLSPIVPVVVGLRLWSRKIIRSRLLWGDIFIVLSCVSLTQRRRIWAERSLTRKNRRHFSACGCPSFSVSKKKKSLRCSTKRFFATFCFFWD